jgi:hypothetical protein
VPTSTGDDVIQKHACVVERDRMLKGEPAAEQCIVLDGVNFLNNADIDGKALPPRGSPNVIMAAGGRQLEGMPQDDAVFAWNFAVNWKDPGKTRITGPQNVMRWEDYTQTAIDPVDDCTIWYAGDYLRTGATAYSSRIGAFRMPGCDGRR